MAVGGRPVEPHETHHAGSLWAFRRPTPEERERGIF
jgi:hypothetical protein